MTFRDFRLSHLLSVEETAKILNVSKETIRKWENGKGIRLKNIRAVANAFNIKPEDAMALFNFYPFGSEN